MSKKTLLNEATIRRFAKLAQIPAMKIEETQTIEEDEIDEAHCPSGKKDDDLEEGMYGKKDDEELEEGVYGRDDDEKLEETEDLEEADMDMDMGEEPEMDMGEEPEMGEVEAEVKIDAGDLESLQAARDVIDQILAAGPGEPGDEPEMDMGGEPEMDMGDAPEMDDEAPMMEIDDEKLQEMINRVTERVSKRIVKEALLRRVKKD